MAKDVALMGLYGEVDAVANTLEKLRTLGIPEDKMTVLSGLPYPPRVLGRPNQRGRLVLFSLGGALAGFAWGLAFNVGTPLLYSIYVGGQPLVPIPPTLILTYEFTMLGLILGTFLGVLWQNGFPTYKPDYYHPEVASGKIALVLHCPAVQEEAAREILASEGAESVHIPERRPL